MDANIAMDANTDLECKLIERYNNMIIGLMFDLIDNGDISIYTNQTTGVKEIEFNTKQADFRVSLELPFDNNTTFIGMVYYSNNTRGCEVEMKPEAYATILNIAELHESLIK